MERRVQVVDFGRKLGLSLKAIESIVEKHGEGEALRKLRNRYAAACRRSEREDQRRQMDRWADEARVKQDAELEREREELKRRRKSQSFGTRINAAMSELSLLSEVSASGVSSERSAKPLSYHRPPGVSAGTVDDVRLRVEVFVEGIERELDSWKLSGSGTLSRDEKARIVLDKRLEGRSAEGVSFVLPQCGTASNIRHIRSQANLRADGTPKKDLTFAQKAA